MGAFFRVLGWLLLVVILAGGYAAYRIGWDKPFTINQLANRQAMDFLLSSPETLTGIGLMDGTILDQHSGKLSEVGVAKRDADYARGDKYLKELEWFPRDKLKGQDVITRDILKDLYESGAATKPFDWLSSEGLYPISPMFGSQVGLVNFLETVHVIKNKKTAENYVKRLEASAKKLDGITAEAQRQAKAGVVLPLALLDVSEKGIADTIAPKPEENPLVTTMMERMKKAKGVDQATQDALKTRAIAAVKDGIYPAFQRMTAALEAMRPEAAQQTPGISRASVPEGAKYYAIQLKQMTTTDYTPDQVHELGLSEVARITGEMDAILKAQGLTKGSVADRVKQLAHDPKYLYPNTDEGREQVLAEYRRILKEVNALMPQYFNTVPPGELKVERVPPSREKGSAGAYYQGAALDGSRPGTFYANLRDVTENPKWAMKTLAYHEGIPGHHFQISTAQGLKGLPLIRQQTLYTAYAEGWALYAERLAAEIGMYKDDPLGDLGRLQAEIFRAARLVLDTGLHTKNWTRQQAIDYMVNATGMSETEVATEVDRYTSLPGQACAYKIGQLKILELREKAKTELGPKFNIKAFHTVVLENGGVPLTLLEQLVNEWIAKAKA
ncbi:MAG: DUF885 domain-containing protein [Alphaproteobacteria bacterium]